MSFWEGLGSALANAAPALVGGTLGLFSQKSANDTNIKLWKMQANYNSPVNQMARLKEAGLNPNLIYGSSSNTGNQTSSAQVQPLDYSFVGKAADSAIQTYLAEKNLKLQNKKIEAEVRQKEIENANMAMDTRMKEYQYTNMYPLYKSMQEYKNKYEGDTLNTRTYLMNEINPHIARAERSLKEFEANVMRNKMLLSGKDLAVYDVRLNAYLSEVKSRVSLNRQHAIALSLQNALTKMYGAKKWISDINARNWDVVLKQQLQRIRSRFPQGSSNPWSLGASLVNKVSNAIGFGDILTDETLSSDLKYNTDSIY